MFTFYAILLHKTEFKLIIFYHNSTLNNNLIYLEVKNRSLLHGFIYVYFDTLQRQVHIYIISLFYRLDDDAYTIC